MTDINKKRIIVPVILLIVVIIFFMLLVKDGSKKDDFFGVFLNQLYNISYDEYVEITEDDTMDFENYIRRDKFENFFTPKGFGEFIADRMSVLYLNEVMNKKCDIELVSYSGDFSTEPYEFWYEYEADKFFYNYEVVVNIIFLENGDKMSKSEKGAISGYIIDDEYKIDSVKIYDEIFK